MRAGWVWTNNGSAPSTRVHRGGRARGRGRSFGRHEIAVLLAVGFWLLLQLKG